MARVGCFEFESSLVGDTDPDEVALVTSSELVGSRLGDTDPEEVALVTSSELVGSRLGDTDPDEVALVTAADSEKVPPESVLASLWVFSNSLL